MKVLLGMSGGTDSSVAALLLQEKGCEVVGITFRFWESGSESHHLNDACELASQLGIEHHVFDAREQFKTEVVDYFIDEYLGGRTPFPCVKCNNTLKWNLLLQCSEKLNCEKIATGHYANIIGENGGFYISKAKDEVKDQTFFLWGLKQHILKKTILPLGNFTKPEIRKIAAEKGFPNMANKKDSMGICFCPGDYRDFLKKQDRVKFRIKKGNFVDETGKFLGRHESYFFYTIGQRTGLGINSNKPVFVKEIHPETNKIVLASIQNMAQNTIRIKNYNLVNINDFTGEFDIITKIHYRKQETPSRIKIIDDNYLQIELAQPLTSVAPGQSAVFYKNGKVLGGGVIC